MTRGMSVREQTQCERAMQKQCKHEIQREYPKILQGTFKRTKEKF